MLKAIGMKMEAVAELVENSVRQTTRMEIKACIRGNGNPKRTFSIQQAMIDERPLS